MARRRTVSCLILASLVAACGTDEVFLGADSGPDAAANPEIYGPLGNEPSVTERIVIQGLDGPADVVRDEFGVIHIYAKSPKDAFLVQGYAMARDRSVQMEVLRRLATGRTAEVLGAYDPATIDQDIAIRATGLPRAASTQYAQMDPNSTARKAIDAFAVGVSQYFAQLRKGEVQLPPEVATIPLDWFEPFSGADVAAISKLLTFAESFSALSEIAYQTLVERSHAVFSVNAKDPEMSRRSGFLQDVIRFQPATSGQVLTKASKTKPKYRNGPKNRNSFHPQLFSELRGYTSGLHAVSKWFGDRDSIGSNAFAINAQRSLSGRAILAADPHFSLGSPPAFWLAQLEVPDSELRQDGLHIAGGAYVGLPGIYLGFNEHLSWAGAATGWDQTDIYAETLSDNGSGVLYNETTVPFEHVQEKIRVYGGNTVTFDVLLVPHHGPVIPNIVDHQVVPPNPAIGALSVRWAGTTAKSDLETLVQLWSARSTTEAIVAAENLESGVMKYCFADESGQVAETASGRLPIRDPRAFSWDPQLFQGTLPCQVLPGDGTAEWTDWVKTGTFTQKSPSDGIVVAANADPTGSTLDNDPSNDKLPDGRPMYFGCSFDIGFRQERISQMIASTSALIDLERMKQVQSDVYSSFGGRLAPHFVKAIELAIEEKSVPGSHPDLTAVVAEQRFSTEKAARWAELMSSWSQSNYASSTGLKYTDNMPTSDAYDTQGSKASLAFNTWFVRLAQLTFVDETSRIGASYGLPDQVTAKALLHLLEASPESLASYDASAKDSAIWDYIDTPAKESKSERIITALLDADDWLEKRFGPRPDDWRWGAMHKVMLGSSIPGASSLTLPVWNDPIFLQGYPRPGDLFSVNFAPYNATPSSFDALSFAFSISSSMRILVEMGKDGPIARGVSAGRQGLEALPGETKSSEVEYWRQDLDHPLLSKRNEVIASARARLVVYSE